MLDKLTFSNTFQALKNAISLAQRRNDLIASNISNVDTPSYKPVDFDFKTALARATGSGQDFKLKQTDENHIGSGGGDTVRVDTYEDTNSYNGYNWVDIDKEMTRLTQNNMVYRTSVEVLMRKIALLKQVIK